MLASNLTAIIHRLKKRRMDTIIVSKELEDRLIHFTHGRKPDRSESADPVHAIGALLPAIYEYTALGLLSQFIFSVEEHSNSIEL
jgi:hypothetical protein